MKTYEDKINNLINGVYKVELVSETSNKVFKVTKEDGEILYAKFYEGNSYHIDNELKIYDLVDNKYLKEIVYKDEKSRIAIFKELVGKTVDELNSEELKTYRNSIVSAVYNYFNSLSKKKVEGYGALDNNLHGKYDTFMNFLKTRQGETSKQLSAYPDLSSISDIIFTNYLDLFISDNSLVPIDTNMKNIMVTNKGEIKFIDPGEMISGPTLMGYGDFVAHCYNTQLYDLLIWKLNLNENEEKLLRIYAIFSSLNILAFLSKLKVPNLDTVIPYGNTKSFKDLIFEHLSYLGIKDKVKSLNTK